MSEYALKNKVTFFVLMTLFFSYGMYKALYFLFGKLILFIPAIRKIEEYKDISLFFSILSSLQESVYYCIIQLNLQVKLLQIKWRIIY